MNSPAKRFFGMGLGAIFTLAAWGVGCVAPAMPSDDSSAAQAEEQALDVSSIPVDSEPLSDVEPMQPGDGAQPAERMMPVSLERGEVVTTGQPLAAGCGALDEIVDPAMGMAVSPPEEPESAASTPASAAAPTWCNGQPCSWCESGSIYNSCAWNGKQDKYAGNHWWDSSANKCYCKASFAGCC